MIGKGPLIFTGIKYTFPTTAHPNLNLILRLVLVLPYCGYFQRVRAGVKWYVKPSVPTTNCSSIWYADCTK